MRGLWARMAAAGAAALLCAAPAVAQVERVDPGATMDADLDGRTAPLPPPQPAQPVPVEPDSDPLYPDTGRPAEPTTSEPSVSEPVGTVVPDRPVGDPNGYERDDLIGAATDVFGKGAQEIGQLIERILADQGKPIGYITGREASGAFVVGLRYGSGVLHHRIEGERPVYWTGPSVGFDVGGNAAKSFILVYNLYDTQDLYRRYPQGEGAAYFVGGFTASYLRRGDVVLIPIRLGVGVRLGANIGYMKFREKNNWVPF